MQELLCILYYCNEDICIHLNITVNLFIYTCTVSQTHAGCLAEKMVMCWWLKEIETTSQVSPWWQEVRRHWRKFLQDLFLTRNEQTRLSWQKDLSDEVAPSPGQREKNASVKIKVRAQVILGLTRLLKILKCRLDNDRIFWWGKYCM